MKNIIISTDYFKNDYSNKEKFIEILQRNNDKFLYFIVTKSAYKGSQIIEELKNNYNLNCTFLPRNSELISNYLDFEVIIGNKDVDFYTATNNKKIIFYDKDFSAEKKVLQYGFEFSIDILDKLLKIIALDKSPYCSISSIPNVYLCSLLNAKTIVNDHYSDDEIKLIEDFEKFIKKNIDVKNKELISYYILLSIRNLSLENPDYISYYPSSTIGPNIVMEDIIKKLRNIYHLKIDSPELLTRVKKVIQSKTLDYGIRLPCTRHFDSISLNSSIDLTDKIIWILDDYSTNGTSFETVRNLLKDKGIKTIVFISIGNFGKPYIFQEYDNPLVPESRKLLKQFKITSEKFPNYDRTLEKLVDILNYSE